MKVWVVDYNCKYEGTFFFELFTSKKKAIKYMNKRNKRMYGNKVELSQQSKNMYLTGENPTSMRYQIYKMKVK